jgi:peptidoglycan/LPS O-acetylase OafA/YrhL
MPIPQNFKASAQAIWRSMGFFLSGLLLARSLSHKGLSLNYVKDRALRIYPALIFFLLMATFVIGPIAAKSWFQWDYDHFYYLINGLFFMDTTTGPVGFYPNNPSPFEYSGQLWTLRFEVLVYFLAPILYLISRHAHKGLMTALTVLAALIVIFIIPSAPKAIITDNLPISLIPVIRLGFCFLLGTMVWLERQNAVFFFLLGMSGALSLCLFPAGTYLGDLSASLMMLCPIVGFALLPQKSVLPSWLKSTPDLSYGVYLWHYPLMQILLGSFHLINPVSLFIVGALLSLIMAAISWNLIEKPALKLKSTHS